MLTEVTLLGKRRAGFQPRKSRLQCLHLTTEVEPQRCHILVIFSTTATVPRLVSVSWWFSRIPWGTHSGLTWGAQESRMMKAFWRLGMSMFNIELNFPKASSTPYLPVSVNSGFSTNLDTSDKFDFSLSFTLHIEASNSVYSSLAFPLLLSLCLTLIWLIEKILICTSYRTEILLPTGIKRRGGILTPVLKI